MSKNQRLNASITIGSVLEQSVKRNIGFLKSGLSSVGGAIKDVERKQRELGKQRKVLEKQGKSVEALDREYEDLSRTLDRLRRKQEHWNRAAGASRRVGSTFNTMASDMVRNGRTIAIGLGLAGGAVFGLASSTAQLGDDVAKTADKLGIGTSELQELRYAAERSGVATSAFDSSLEKMTKNIGLALEGTGAQKDALDALGLSAGNLATMLPEEALGLIADRMQGVATQAEKAAIANDIFGRSGIGMLNMLRGGSKGLRDLRDDARRTGYVLSEQAARDAEVFQDTLLDTQLVMKGLKNTVGAELMPVVTQSMRRIGDALVGNREQVKVWAASFADNVERALPVIGDVASGIGKVLTVTGSMIGKTADMVGGWENFGVVIGGILASRTVLRVGKFAFAVGRLGTAMWALAGAGPFVAGAIKAIGLAIAANPIGAVLTAIAIGATLIVANWEKVKPVVEPILTWLGDTLKWVWDAGGEPLIDGLRKGSTLIGNAWSGLKDVMEPTLTWLGQTFDAAWAKVQPVLDGLKWVAGSNGSVMNGLDGKTPVPGANKGLDRAKGMIPTGSRLPSVTDRFQKNALGGPFGPGWHLTGEMGPELKFENRSGYVANNRAMRQLASYADRVGSAMPQDRTVGRTAGASMSRTQRSLRSHRTAPQGATQALSGMSARIEAALGGGAPKQAVAAASSEVTQNITNHFHASGVSADELMSIAERKRRTQAQGALFDRAPVSGPFGR